MPSEVKPPDRDDIILAKYNKAIRQVPMFNIIPTDSPQYVQQAFDDIYFYIIKNENDKMHLEFLIEDLRFRLAKLEKAKK